MKPSIEKSQIEISFWNKVHSIDTLIIDKKYELAEKETKELLKKNPNHTLLCQLALIYKNTGRYDEAIGILEQMKTKYTYRRLTALYLKTNSLDQLYDLFLEVYHYNNFAYDSRDYRSKIYLEKMFNMTDSFYLQDSSYYFLRQILDFQEKLTIENIQNKAGDLPYSFSANVNLGDLLEKTKQCIMLNPDKAFLTHFLTELYYFYIPKCGVNWENGSDLNYCLIETFINTNQIVGMRPIEKPKRAEIIDVNEPQVWNSHRLIRTKTGLERFYDRYGKK